MVPACQVVPEQYTSMEGDLKKFRLSGEVSMATQIVGTTIVATNWHYHTERILAEHTHLTPMPSKGGGRKGLRAVMCKDALNSGSKEDQRRSTQKQ